MCAGLHLVRIETIASEINRYVKQNKRKRKHEKQNNKYYIKGNRKK